MTRSKPTCVASLVAALVLGCGVPQERSVLDRFFAASRLRDTTALATFATVIFEPLEDGIVTGFEILEIARPAAAAGQAESRDITIRAPVKLPSGQIAEKTLHVTLERRDGRWIVTAFRQRRPP
jgi:hypothetical protein